MTPSTSTLNPLDFALLSLCLYREARGEGQTGMTAVGCVVRNRVARKKSSYYAEVTAKWQFSSISAAGDPQLINYPAELDPYFQAAQMIASHVIDGGAADPTGGATLYYAFKAMAFPKDWNPAAVVHTVDIGGHRFYREI